MQFAVDGTNARLEPTPKAKGFCPACGCPVVAKCGEILTWHWSHLAKDCDPWYEPESIWHRQWKEQFPSDWREVVIGKHRADVQTPKGIIEFQASCISASEIQERENFYQKMVWVVKADAFDFEKKLSPYARSRYLVNYSPENVLDLLGPHSSEVGSELAVKINKINAQVRSESWDADPMYRWRWPRKSWLFARKKIYMDRGDNLFRVDWFSEDGKIIKGRHCSKDWFVQKALRARF